MAWFTDAHGMATTSTILDSVPTTPVSEMLQLFILLAWTCLQVTKKKNAIFNTVFPSVLVITQVMSSYSLTCCPGLFDMLQAATVPTLAQLKSLPSDFHKRWGIYLLVFEKKSCRPRIYIGSGTNAAARIHKRMYEYATICALPGGVAAALREGHTVTHEGLLLWVSMPSSQDVPLLRALLVLLEAVLCFAFWAIMRKGGGDSYSFGIPQLCSWDVDSLLYTGLCTHSPLVESIGVDFSLSPQDLKDLAEKRRRYVNDTRRPTTQKRHDKNRATKKFYCSVCDLACSSQPELNIHLASKKHKKMLKAEPPKTKNQRCRSRKRADQSHHCAVCDHSFPDQSSLDRLCTTKKHQKMVLLSSSGSS
jgi:hypothetical protein